jgi:hypothetical protein
LRAEKTKKVLGDGSDGNGRKHTKCA